MQINIIETIMHLSDICYSLNEDTLRDQDVSRPESFIILSINPGESITSNELAVRNRLSPSRISRIVDHMVEKGLLVRIEDPGDRRFIHLSLSTEGIKKHKTLAKLKNQCEQKIRAELQGDEYNTVARGLDILTNVMEKKDERNKGLTA